MSILAYSVCNEVAEVEYLSIRETAKKWGLSPRRVQVLCATDRIPGAFRVGNVWAIPVDAEKPNDARIKTGQYVKTTTSK